MPAHPQTRWPLSRSFRAVVGLVTLALAGGAVFPLSASASPSVATQSSTAIVTPLLTLFEFGDTVGLPEGCQTSLTAVSAVIAQANLSGQFSPIATQIGTACQKLSDEGSIYIQKGLTASQSASALNALLNPLVANSGNLLTTAGNEPGVQDSPLGPTIAGLGQTVTFFEGS